MYVCMYELEGRRVVWIIIVAEKEGKKEDRENRRLNSNSKESKLLLNNYNRKKFNVCLKVSKYSGLACE